jgi:hypothetical protein
MAMGLFQSIDWLTKKIKSLCCWLGIIEEQIGATLPYVEIYYEGNLILDDWNTGVFMKTDGSGGGDFTSVSELPAKFIYRLYGSSGDLRIKPGAFNGGYSPNVYYIQDPFGLITNVGDDCLKNNIFLTLLYLPAVKAIGPQAFSGCTALTTIYIPKCTDLGGSVVDNSVFENIIGNAISLKIDPSRLTCNAGLPDGDIQTLQTNNTVAIL